MSVPDSFQPFALAQEAAAFATDAAQRTVLFFDLLRARGDAYLARQKNDADPHVLHFEAAVLIDGRDLLPAVNYRLMRILPPGGVVTDPKKRPFIVFDPRAGQGAGIGGMKRDSEVGLALLAGHPVYFVGFLPEPVPEQTIEDACKAEAHFVAKVTAWHPEAPKPCLIGNCQAGWQIALMASIHADLPGVLILAGAPLSYWAGVQGESPMRYTAGLTGGSWLNAFLTDVGGGLFDGAWLVQSFEMNNPATTFWKKYDDLYARVDTEGPRFLEFERWWGMPVFLGAKEIQFIADELFIGNHLTQGKIHTPSGLRVDLRNIRAPIVVFCSRGDDITPPAQALGWLADLYSCDDDILAAEQTIVYALHEKIGHLGLFVSSSVMGKELHKFIGGIDMIEMLPPGLYEAVFLSKDASRTGADLASGDYVLRFERRSLDDIRALGAATPEEERCFETVARLSENLQGLYHTFVAPWVKMFVTREMAALFRQAHPLRAQFAFFSSDNPLLADIPVLAKAVREERTPASPDNLFWGFHRNFAALVEKNLDAANELKNRLAENLFFSIYSQPLLQASVGLRTVRPYDKPRADRDVQIEQERTRRLEQLLDQVGQGGLIEATIRGLLYVSRGERAIDEREFRMLDLLRRETDLLPSLEEGDYKTLVRRQYMMLVLDEARALQAIPELLDRAQADRAASAMAAMRTVFTASGALSPEEERRLDYLAGLFAPSGKTPHRRATDKR